MELVAAHDVVCCGEAMVELHRAGDGWKVGHGGDTLNTAIHLARAGLRTAYLTALGGDPFSAGLRAGCEREGVDSSLILTHPTRQPGLYAITTDRAGERSFTYWRDTAAAREMFALPGMAAMTPRVERARLFVFSLISMAILPDDGRAALLALAGRVRDTGGAVAFDSNYRPRLWASRQEAAQWRDRAIAVADYGLPTLEDEAALSDQLADAPGVAAHWQGLGCREVVVKLGRAGCRLPDGGVVAPAAPIEPVDTSGAGDAFNAGYLAARLNGQSIERAARNGHALAGWTIMRPGAIPARDY